MLPLVIAAALLPAELTVTREVTVRTSLRAKAYVWVVTDGVAIVPRLVRDNGRAVTFDHRPGSRYFVAVTALAEDGTEQAESTVIGVVDPPGPGPQPNPGPRPDPVPPPDPRPDPPPANWTPWGIVVIEETSEAAAARGAMLANRDLAALIRERKLAVRIVDKDVRTPAGSPPADIARFLEQAKTKSLPRVWLVDTAGVPRAETEVPKAPTDFLAWLKKSLPP